jgi:hypothetical protein
MRPLLSLVLFSCINYEPIYPPAVCGLYSAPGPPALYNVRKMFNIKKIN